MTEPLSQTIDQRVFLHGVTWQQYEALLAMRGDSAGVRIAYLEGEVELTSPSRSHEWIKTCIARLVEAYCEESDLELNGYGSWTLKSQPDERGAEADECYVLGSIGERERPDFAIEVVWTSGGINKLEIYRGLGVQEVWFWKNDEITIYDLGADGYERVDGSRFLPELDLAHLLTFVGDDGQTAAVRRYRAWLRERRSDGE